MGYSDEKEWQDEVNKRNFDEIQRIRQQWGYNELPHNKYGGAKDYNGGEWTADHFLNDGNTYPIYERHDFSGEFGKPVEEYIFSPQQQQTGQLGYTPTPREFIQNNEGSIGRHNAHYNAQPYSPPYNPTMDDYINQMENENSAAWQYSGGGRTEPLMPNVRHGNNLLYELLRSIFDDRGDYLLQQGREQSIRDTLARDGIY